jgi:CheY-like chemotaxis protein
MTLTTHRKILLVDDDSAGAELTLAALSMVDPEASVAVVGDGEEALDYLFRRGAYEGLADEPPGSMLLDLKMPKVDGHEVLRQVRADPALRGLKVVVLTSSDQPQDRELSRQLGTDDYVLKSPGIAGLIDELRRCSHLLKSPGDSPP